MIVTDSSELYWGDSSNRLLESWFQSNKKSPVLLPTPSCFSRIRASHQRGKGPVLREERVFSQLSFYLGTLLCGQKASLRILPSPEVAERLQGDNGGGRKC